MSGPEQGGRWVSRARTEERAAPPLEPSPTAVSAIGEMAGDVQGVVEAADRAAEMIRTAAEEQARDHLAEARRTADQLTAERVGLIFELTDGLIEQAADLRHRGDEMLAALDRTIASLNEKLGPEEPGPAPAPQGLHGDAFEDAVVHATLMAVEGRDREAISAELRRSHGIAEPGEILDLVLGGPFRQI